MGTISNNFFLGTFLIFMHTGHFLTELASLRKYNNLVSSLKFKVVVVGGVKICVNFMIQLFFLICNKNSTGYL